VTFYHVNTQERPSINFYGELPQDQSALRNMVSLATLVL
jgi:hypothetical protein